MVQLDRTRTDEAPANVLELARKAFVYLTAASTMAMSCSVVPPLTPRPAITWPSMVNGTPPPIAEYRPPETASRGKSGCPGCTRGTRSAVRIRISAEVWQPLTDDEGVHA